MCNYDLLYPFNVAHVYIFRADHLLLDNPLGAGRNFYVLTT